MAGTQIRYTYDAKAGLYVGFLSAFPNLVCQAKTLDLLQDRIFASLEKYARHMKKKDTIVRKEF